jgi:hypothetical protein
MIYGLLDRLTERYSENEHKLEAMRAREEFFDRAGKVFDDDAELFEGRMASFLEWYVLERPLGKTGSTTKTGKATETGGRPPIAHAIEAGAALPAAERRMLAHLASSHRSLFQLGEAAERVLEVEDVIGGARFSVVERRNTVGIAPGDVFEARLLWDGDSVIFGRTFLFHPPDARDVILDWVERATESGTSRDEILFHLSRQYVRWHRLGHVGAAKVYRDA